MTYKQAAKAIVWACLSSWYYGYHITELNLPAKGLMCHPSPATDGGNPYLPPCIGLDAARYGTVTSLLTAGGLLGSLASDRLVAAEGVAGAISWTGWLNLASALLMGLAPHWLVMGLGRFVAGLACGLAVCLVPPYLAALARATPSLAAKSGQVGTLHQLAIVLGICSSQVFGLIFTGPEGNKPGAWRWVVAMSGVASVIQIIMTAQPINVEENQYAAVSAEETRASLDEERAATGPLSPSLEESAAAPLLQPKAPGSQLTTRDLLSTPSLRGPALLVTAMLCLQQLSGVNAVLFYSASVLDTILPNAGAGILSVGITVVNALMTFPAIFLVDRVGRRQLLLFSAVGMGIMAILLAKGLDNHWANLSAFAIVTFIAAFAVGLGPVPFLLVSEMVPPHAVPALSSLALAASWITTLLVGKFFLPLRELLTTPVDPTDPESPVEGEGRVFYVFAVFLAIATLVTLRGVPK